MRKGETVGSRPWLERCGLFRYGLPPWVAADPRAGDERQGRSTLTRDHNDEILFEVQGQIATITFNRPQARNAMTWNMYDRLVQYCDELDANDEIRVAILRGAGDRAFVAGTDIGQFQAFKDPKDAIDYEKRTGEVTGRLERVGKPTIAMIHGYCVGGGASIALACDFRYVAPSLRFGIPIARTLGNCLSLRGYSRLIDYVGPAKAKELIMLARLLNAEEGLGLGIVTEVIPAEDLEARVREVAEQLTQLAPLTLRATKEGIRRIQAARGLDNREGEDLILSCYMSEDFQGAVQAFLEKRSYSWTGR